MSKLIFTRKRVKDLGDDPRASFWIGDAKVTLLRNGRVAVEAPAEVKILRGELKEKAA